MSSLSPPKVSPKKTTIDHLGLESHVRYARDIEALDPNYLKEVDLVLPMEDVGSHHPRIDTLFEYREEYLPWALFAPPPENAARRRLFREGYPLFAPPSTESKGEDREGEEESAEDEKETVFKKFFKMKMRKRLDLPEEERGAVETMMATIDLLNALLQQIHTRKIHFQKG